MTELPSNFDGRVSILEFINIKDTVLKLKAAREAENLSINDILVKLELSGANISESTVRRVFRDNSENEGGFTYVRALKPIVDVLIPEDELETSDDPALLEKYELLHAVMKEKNRMIEELQSKNDALTSRNEELTRRIDEFRKEYDKRISFLRDQIEKKDKRMDDKDVMIQKLMEKVL